MNVCQGLAQCDRRFDAELERMIAIARDAARRAPS